jgi:RNA methyltransferase, TrmH family
MLTARENKELRGLHLRRNREAAGRFLAEGVRVVEDLVRSGLNVHYVVASSSLEDNDRGRALLDEVAARRIGLRVVSDREFDPLAATDAPQGVLAVAEIPSASLTSLVAAEPPSVLLVLDAVQDPGNFGTLVRSAEALGAAGIVALPGTVDPWNSKAVRSAAGSSFRVPIVQATWAETATALRRAGFRLLGAALEGRPLRRASDARVALVVGNEGAGLSDPVRDGVDELVSIPLRGRAESLNVAAAAAILLYELSTRPAAPADPAPAD